MEHLPVEIIEIILSTKKLNIEDVLNFGGTCRRLRDVISKSNSTWKCKFRQRWPELYEIVEYVIVDWFEETKHVFAVRNSAHSLLERMPEKHHTKEYLSEIDLDDWKELVNDRAYNDEYIVYDLVDMVKCQSSIESIEVVPLLTPGNKTLRYYAQIVLQFIRQLQCSNEWRDYMDRPSRTQILEIGATIIAQWFQPEKIIRYEHIAAHFDAIACQVKDYLHTKNDRHPLFQIPDETLKLWAESNLSKNQFCPRDSKQILTGMKHVLSEKLNFCGNSSNYYMPENSYVNEVLESKQGLPITLSIIYESVGRRLGLNCEPINSPAHFLLRFRESDDDVYYVDVFNKGEIIRSSMCSFSHYRDVCTVFQRASALEVIERMTNNLEVALRDRARTTNAAAVMMRTALEFHVLIQPSDLPTIVYLARLYMTYNMDVSRIEEHILSQNFKYPEQAQRVLNMLHGYQAHIKCNKPIPVEVQPIQHDPRVEYAVGMVMKHKLFNYTCVICDWHTVCMETVQWQSNMNVGKLQYGAKQPFYAVLVEDGSKRYVAQENLEATADTGFLYLNEDIGKHFSHFFQTHYVPNAEKEKQYPEDKAVRYRFHMQFLLLKR